MLPSNVPEPVIQPGVGILDNLYRMSVNQYERLVESGVLGDQPIELIDGLLVKKTGKKPPHVLACEASRDELLHLVPRGWRVAIETPVRIPDFDEPEPDLTIVRGTRDMYEDRHPGPADVGLLIEVSDTTLDFERGVKALAYARGGVSVYWIVNLVDRQVEIYTQPGPDGFQQRQIVPADGHVRLVLDGHELGQIAVFAILPRARSADRA
jgi:Uma2 family endonuclease